MWLTQTYLEGPRNDFPIYGYAFFNPYTDWDSAEIQSLKRILGIFGRETESRVAFYAPNSALDHARIGEELDHKFGPLVHDKLAKGGIYAGLYFSNKRLEDTKANGSNARFAFFKVEKDLKLRGTKFDLEQFLPMAASASMDSKDPVQTVVLETMKSVNPSRAKKIIKGISFGAGGPSISLDTISQILSGSPYLTTNIWD